MKESKERLLWMDIIKIISTFLIVLQHAISQGWVQMAETHSNKFFVMNFVYMFSKAGVPLFFMCSGMGMFQKRRTIRSIFKNSIVNLLIPYVSWMVVWGIVEALNGSSFRTGVNCIIKSIIFGHYHTWFIATLIGLYIIVPFLQEFVHDKELRIYFLGLAFVFAILMPYVDGIEWLERVQNVILDFNMHFVIGYVLYFVLGYHVGLMNMKKETRYVAGGMWIIVWVVGAIISYMESREKGQACQAVYTDYSILGFLFAVSFFLFIKGLCYERKETEHPIVIKIVGLGIGIYLVHPLFLPLVDSFVGFERFWAALIIYGVSGGICWILSMLPVKKWFLGIK